LAKHTDAIATLPLSVVSVLAEDLDLQIIKPPSAGALTKRSCGWLGLPHCGLSVAAGTLTPSPARRDHF